MSPSRGRLRGFAGALALALTVGLADRAAADPTSATPTGVFGEWSKDTLGTSATGSLTQTIHLRMPPGRGNVGASLDLTYDSATGDREAGMGWGLSLPSIERAPTSGWPRYADGTGGEEHEDRYAYAGERLELVCTVGAGACDGMPMPSWAAGWRFYRTRYKSESFARFFLSPNRKTWKVQHKGGVIREFGVPESGNYPAGPGEAFDCAERGQDCSESGPAPIFRWRLAREEDLRGNHVVYGWARMGNRGLAYLTDVWDVSPIAAGGLESFALHVSLRWQGWGAPASYVKLDRAKPDLRLERVTIAAKGWQDAEAARSLVAAYHFNYLDPRATPYVPGLQAPLFGHTFLTSVEEEGACDVPEGPQEVFALGKLCPQTPEYVMPPVTFRYSEGAFLYQLNGLSEVENGPANEQQTHQSLRWLESTSVMDLNGDGLPDIFHGWEGGGPAGAATSCAGEPGIVGVARLGGSSDPTAPLVLACDPLDPLSAQSEIAVPVPAHKAYMNVGGATGLTARRMDFKCIDAQPIGHVHASPPASPAGAPMSFMTLRHGTSLQGAWGDSLVAWHAPAIAPSPPVFAGFGLAPAPAVDGCQTGTNPSPSAGYAWAAENAASWYVPPQSSDPPATWAMYADIDGDGVVDRLINVQEWPITGVEHMRVQFSRRYVLGEAQPVGIAERNKLQPFQQGPDTTLTLSDPQGIAYYADVNGDGAPDFVDTRGQQLTVYPGTGRGPFGCDDREVPCANPVPGAPTWLGRAYLATFSHGPPLSLPNDGRVYLHDVTGDGLADVVTYDPRSGNVRLWVNEDGHTFTCPFQGVPGQDPCVIGRFRDGLHLSYGQCSLLNNGECGPGDTVFPHTLTFADMDGNGTDDIVVTFGAGLYYVSPYDRLHSFGGPPGARVPRPGLLVAVDNGRGAETQVQYATVQELDLEARGAEAPTFPREWRTHSPRVDTLVTDVRVHDKGLVSPSPFAFDRTTRYAYQDPMFDPWTRQLLGFRRVRMSVLGEAAVTDTWYAFGPCHHTLDSADGTGGAAGCAETSEGPGHTKRPGLVDRVDRLIPPAGPGEPGTWLSIVTFAYDTFNAVDTTQTYLFDTNTPAVGGDPEDPNALPTQAGLGHIKTVVARDEHGNVMQVVDHGNVAGAVAEPRRRTKTSHTQCNGNWVCAPSPGTSQEVTVFEDLGAEAPPSMWRRRVLIDYTWQGEVSLVQAELRGDLSALPRHPTLGAPPPGSVVDSGLVMLAGHWYDDYGNVLYSFFPGGGGYVLHGYDAAYNQYPSTTETVEYTSARTFTSDTVFDRRFGAQTLEKGWDYTVRTVDLDAFGRPKAVFAPAPDNPSLGATALAAQLAYKDTGPVGYVRVERWVAQDKSQKSYVLTNSLGEPSLGFDQADPNSGDLGAWVQHAYAERNAYGQVIRTHRPGFSSVDPEQVALSGAAPPMAGAEITRVIDTFARPTGVLVGSYPGTLLSRTTYGAMSVKLEDADQIATGAGYTRVHVDGHGRRSKIERRSATHNVDVLVAHAITGDITSVQQLDTDSGASVTRSMGYDELGRMVWNDEPNSGPWQYRYDAAGHLVATSDARQCGVNYHYDGLGRVLAEDFSPCEPHHQPYSPPDLTTGDGAEAFYRYDEYELGQFAPTAEFLDDPRLAIGELISVKDRGGHTRYHHDARNRVRRVSRRLAKPGAPSDLVDERYTAHWYEQAVEYDLGDRLTKRSTGADVAELLVEGQSYESFFFTGRGALGRQGSSYGDLVSGMEHSAEGQATRWTYGDASQTLGTATYDATRGWMNTYKLARAPAAAWGQPTASYTAPPAETTPLQLADVYSIQRNEVGSPTQIDDGAVGWSAAGSLSTRRTITYDGFQRVTSVTTNTNGDPGASPFAPEMAAGSSRPVPTRTGTGRTQTQTFDYDFLGNTQRTEDDQFLRFDRSLGAITNDAAHPNQLRDADGVHADYDAAGNLVSLTVERPTCDGSGTTLCTHRFVYDWDETNQLARARRWDYPMGAIPASEPAHPSVPTATPAWDIEYAYTAGARVRKSASQGGLPARHSVEIFDTLRLDDAEWQVDDYESNRRTMSAYVGGLGKAFFDPNAELPSADGSLLHVYLSLGDHLGSTSVVIDKASGEVVERAHYQAYGETESNFRPDRWGGHRDTYRFTGKEEDVEVGLTYFGARYYHARLGRWMSPDPLTVHGLGADLNPYAYVGGNVLGAVDPWGLAAAAPPQPTPPPKPPVDSPQPPEPPPPPKPGTITQPNGTTVTTTKDDDYDWEPQHGDAAQRGMPTRSTPISEVHMTTEGHNPRPIGPPTPEGTFGSTDAAARAALRAAFRRTKRDGFESGGGIFKILVGRSAGQFSFYFVGGARSETSVEKPQRAPGRPGAAILVASFHSHTPGPKPDTFSDPDYQNAFDAQKPSFMVGPSGKMWMLMPAASVPRDLGALTINSIVNNSLVTPLGRTR
ncbi:MAG: RHS repeat-associated core domain-containing protein [Polyangiaceae bacterium]